MILGFKTAFVPQIEAGVKAHTIRQGSRWKVGDIIHFYANVRQPGMYKFRPDAVVLAVQQVRIRLGQMEIDGRELSAMERIAFARKDGFDSPGDMRLWFARTHSLPFEGQLIHWTDLTY